MYREVFEAARKSLEDGDYATAQARRDSVTELIVENCSVRVEGSSEAADCSIIVTSYRHSDQFVELLQGLKAYQRQPYELIFVNNGNETLDETLTRHLQRFKVVSPGFNYGCPGGRNVGVAHAQGEYVLFLDDDGVIALDAIERLLEAIASYQAVVVRGRVMPRTTDSHRPDHYDMGRSVCPCPPDAEGFSIWRRDVFRRFGGFDPLLRAHEGTLLAAKSYRFFGPQAYLYTPHAVMRHDFSPSTKHAVQKLRNQAKIHGYLDYCEPSWREVVRSIRSAAQTPEFLSAWGADERSQSLPTKGAKQLPISVITTARNAERFVAEYSQSLKQQTHSGFEVVFVDDGSDDGTEQAIKALWSDDARLRYVRSDPIGRAAALNLALSMARNDVCAIADVDDLSAPARLEWTATYFTRYPQASCIGFLIFTDDRPIRGFLRSPCSIRVRSLLGMPAPFPAFAFRRSAFSLPFDEDRSAGVDCDWLFRNLQASDIDGRLIPIPAVYYRLHDAQITTIRREEQRSVALNCLYSLHGRILNRDVTPFKDVIQKLSKWKPITSDEDLSRAFEYCGALHGHLKSHSYCDSDAAAEYLRSAWTDLTVRHLSGVNPPVHGVLALASVAGLRPMVRRFSSQRALRKFERDPGAFFRDMILRRLPGWHLGQRARR